ncbi:binding-protein-dependent transport systems inner membrane component [Beutenbergia cavernae DSM 12333]|uniref:Binding-protein-dependent transport systems inner membrane component n=2 Tax=Beutenbergia TaxID=84756 RepID=C5C596_BEUC1|nr:binding-protein-dependent transport systems inner membrane component [Beutenbergia cavernae DSM 12333]
MSWEYVSFLAVFLVFPVGLFLLFVIWPFAQAAFYALTDWSGFSDEFNVVGLDNFVKLWNDPLFMTAVGNSMKLALVVPLVTVVVSLAFASLITVGGQGRGQIRGLGGSGFYRVISFFPYVIPGIVIAIMWRLILDPQMGLVNGVLTGIGLNQFEDFPWLGRVATAMPWTMFVMIWGFVGFYMLLFIAAIKGVPAETYEAARLDGAGRIRMAWSVTLPLIRDNVQTAWIYLGIGALDGFVYVVALNPSGGPENSTLVMSQQLFRTAFTQGQFGYASAMGVILALVTLLFAAIVFSVNRLLGGRDEKGRA